MFLKLIYFFFKYRPFLNLPRAGCTLKRRRPPRHLWLQIYDYILKVFKDLSAGVHPKFNVRDFMVNWGLQSQHCSDKNLPVLRGPGRLTVKKSNRSREKRSRRPKENAGIMFVLQQDSDLKWIEKTMKRSEWLSQRPTACVFIKKAKGEFRESIKYLVQIEEIVKCWTLIYLQMIIHLESVTDWFYEWENNKSLLWIIQRPNLDVSKRPAFSKYQLLLSFWLLWHHTLVVIFEEMLP